MFIVDKNVGVQVIAIGNFQTKSTKKKKKDSWGGGPEGGEALIGEGAYSVELIDIFADDFQTNGLTERMNASIKMGLRKLKERKGDWPVFLNQVLRGLRWHSPRSTKYSPFELAFSFKPRIHVVEGASTTDDVEDMINDFLSGKTADGEAQAAFEKDAGERCCAHEAKFEEAQDNIRAEQHKQKEAYDRKREMATFKAGDKVLLQNSRKRTRKGEDLDMNFSGPYIIKRVTKVNTAYLESEDPKKKMQKAVSCSRLKHFFKADEPHTSENSGKGRPPLRTLKFNPPDVQELKTMAYKLNIDEEVDIQRPPFGQSSEFSSLTKPSPQNMIRVQGDGNCLFRSLSVCVTGSEDNHPALRNGIIEYMRKDEEDIFSKLLADIEGYISKGVGTPATPDSRGKEHWGTDIEISAFCTLLGCSVMVWKDQENQDLECWLVYDPLPPPSTRKTRKTDKASKFTFLLHAPFEHFNVVLRP